MTGCRPLVAFNTGYYRYPRTVHRYLIEEELDHIQKEERSRWLEEIQARRHSSLGDFVQTHFSSAADPSLIVRLAASHGVFVERFFHHVVRRIVAEQWGGLQRPLAHLRGLLFQAWGYQVSTCDRDSDAIYWLADTLYEHSVLALVEDAAAMFDLARWYAERRNEEPCLVCGRPFRVVDLPDWIYFGSAATQGCCFACPVLERPRKADMPALVADFVEACGFIPGASSSPIAYSFMSRIPADRRIAALRAYADMGGVDHAKKKFRSWFVALVRAGVLPGGVQSTGRGFRCLAYDGHECQSLEEQQIDDWLTAHGVLHDREPSYPAHPVFNPSGRRRADWRIGDTYVEYFGLVGEENYDEKSAAKIALAAQAGIALVVVYPDDLPDLEPVFRPLSWRGRTAAESPVDPGSSGS